MDEVYEINWIEIIMLMLEFPGSKSQKYERLNKTLHWRIPSPQNLTR